MYVSVLMMTLVLQYDRLKSVNIHSSLWNCRELNMFTHPSEDEQSKLVPYTRALDKNI